MEASRSVSASIRQSRFIDQPQGWGLPWWPWRGRLASRGWATAKARKQAWTNSHLLAESAWIFYLLL